MVDPYLQDDGKTLKNKLGILSDPAALAAKEAVHVHGRLMELRANGLPQAEGFELVKAIHQYLFQDVYDWAGQLREVNLAKGIYAENGSDVVQFTPPHRIEVEGRRLFGDFDAADRLQGLVREEFVEALAPFFGRLNDLHPFCEGNGRTQRLVWEHLAKEAGHELSFEGVSRERMIVVSIAASTGDFKPAHRMFTELLDPTRSQALRTATRFLEANRTPAFDWQDRYVATTEPGQSYTGTFVGADGGNFMMHDGRNILIGRLADLTNTGPSLHAGDRVAFRAVEMEQTQQVLAPMSAAERLRVRAEQVAERIASEHAAARAVEKAHDQRQVSLERTPSKSHEQELGRGLDLDP